MAYDIAQCNIGLSSDSLVANFDKCLNCPQAWKIPLSNGPKLNKMIRLTANAAIASTTSGTPKRSEYDKPAAIKTAEDRNVSANTCFNFN